ncbi:hypothetical protein INR49_002079, partial [Caranx melampygus]
MTLPGPTHHCHTPYVLFITGGVVAIILDKHSTFKTACLMVSFVSTVLSVVAVIIYSVDLDGHPELSCVTAQPGSCSAKHYSTTHEASHELQLNYGALHNHDTEEEGSQEY